MPPLPLTPGRRVGIAVFATIVASDARTLTTGWTLGTVLTVTAIRALAAILAVIARLALSAVLAVVTLLTVTALGTFILIVAGVEHLLVAILVVEIVFALAAGILILEARAALAEHAKIMVGVLQVIFRLHAVAGELRVARHALVFLQELGGVAALAIVLPVTGLAAEVLAPRSATATTTPAAVLSIVDQMPTSLRSV